MIMEKYYGLEDEEEETELNYTNQQTPNYTNQQTPISSEKT